MRISNWVHAGIALLVFVGACDRSPEKGIPDDQVGLVNADIRDTPTPASFVENTTEPGEKPALAPAYDGSPPVIPHGIADFLPITQDQNFCLDCHLVPEKVEGEATPIPPSHFVDLRNAPETSQESVVGARTHCIACHVPQTNALPLVGSDFAKED